MNLMNQLLAFVITALLALSCSTTEPNKPQLIPVPNQVELKEGSFTLTSQTHIVVNNEKLIPLAELLNVYLERLAGFQLNISEGTECTNGIFMRIAEGYKTEEYKLQVKKAVQIEAADYNGMALGMATLVQLLQKQEGKIILPGIAIADRPDYGYRTVMLDLARFWHPVETIKETIDLLWLYKIRYLHLHLSDNRRFTFPLDEFPDLKTVNEDGTREYYTDEELKGLVEYARERGIAIIPEVELPGHSAQLFTKYPETFGSVDSKTGEAKYIHVINMAKEEVYNAAELIIKKLSEVFYTSPYIHIGCDEVYLEVLKTVPEYKPFCKEYKLDAALNGDANELFCYFINRLNEMVKATGKKSIIWEGFHGTGAGSQTIAKEIPVIVWNTTYNHPDSLIANGYEIINSTWVPWYLVGAMNLAADQEKAYTWDLTKWSHWDEEIQNIELNAKNGIRGGQICYWEQNHFKVVPDLKKLVPVLSERLWNNDTLTGFADFQNRFKHANEVCEKLFQPVKVEWEGLLSREDLTFIDKVVVKMNSDQPGKIKYSFSNSWNLPQLNKGAFFNESVTLDESGILAAQLFNDQEKAIGYPVQYYLQKIVPAYNYTVYGGTPQHGWEAMPDFSTLPVIRKGKSGFMTPERLQKINEELFAKVKTEGHIEVRFRGIHNPYAVELRGTLNLPETQDYTFRVQTHDGLAELYVDDKTVGEGTEFNNAPEEFTVSLTEGDHQFSIHYFYKQIQNQLSILYKTPSMDEFKPFEELVLPIK